MILFCWNEQACHKTQNTKFKRIKIPHFTQTELSLRLLRKLRPPKTKTRKLRPPYFLYFCPSVRHFSNLQPPAYIYNSTVFAMAFTIC